MSDNPISDIFKSYIKFYEPYLDDPASYSKMQVIKETLT